MAKSTNSDVAIDMDTELEKKAISYAEGYSEVGYDDDQIASVRDAFIDGAKWQKKQVWHTQNDNPPHEDEKIIFLWGQSNNIKDLNADVGRLRLICGEKLICGWSRWYFEDVKLWACLEDLVDL